MNSTTKHLSSASILALLRLIRSAKKEIILVVEGDQDVDLFSQSLGLPKSCLVSCSGKERLMQVYSAIPDKSIDLGVIFIRDSDFDQIAHQQSHGIVLLVSDRYDFEMVVIEGRLFGRIFAEFLKHRATASLAQATFSKIVDSSAWVGALRWKSQREDLGLDFDELEFKFIDPRTLDVDVRRLIKLIYARSRVTIGDVEKVVGELDVIRKENQPLTSLCCGKDFLQILAICLCRQQKVCNYNEGSPATLGRIIRIATTFDDIRSMSLFPLLKNAVEAATKANYVWSGSKL